ncbi:protein FLX-like 1 [Oryza brachyantha]|uniref:Uncharacterized protein n=1 Tax=Oryza brachyantha TaxID=4533 RepID=J3LJQ8_ORYBR|nr:protein FLX-like 1 [Oryza brachyantha]XP_040377543.1 protein FLX-like 1 [Oryza brachyantha]
MMAELAQVRLDIQRLGVAMQELMSQVQGFTQDLARSAVDLQQVAALKAEIQEIRHETQHLRSGIEVDNKRYAESYEQGQDMHKKLISVASKWRSSELRLTRGHELLFLEAMKVLNKLWVLNSLRNSNPTV